MSIVKRFAAPLIGLVRLHLVAVIIVAALILLYTLLGFFAVPRIARAQLESYVTEQLHRQVSVGEIRFNPFAFDTSIAGLTLREADGSPVVSFRHLYVNAELASIWQRAVVLKEVQLSAPDINAIVAKDGTLNLAKLAPESTPEEASTEQETALPRVRIGRLDIRDGRIGLTDNTHAQPFTAAVAPIKFTLTDFKTDLNYENAYDFSGTTASGEQLEWAGNFTVQPLGSTGRFRVQGLKAATIDSYAEDSLPFELASGNATLDGNYRFAMTPTLGFDATLPLLQVRDLSIKQRKTKDAPINVPAVDIHDIALSYEKRDVGMKRIDVKGAHVDVALEPDGSISLMRLFGEESSGSAQPVAAAPASMPATTPDTTSASTAAAGGSVPQGSQDDSGEWRVRAETIQLSEGTVLAEDRTVQPVAKFELAPVALTVNGWSTDASAKVQVDAEVTINKKGKLLGKGDMQLAPLSAQFAVELRDFELPEIQPYLNATTAMTLHSGRLGVKGDVSYSATPESAPPVKFKGEVRVADLRTTDQLVNEDFVKWRSLTMTGIDFSQHPDKLAIDRIVARQPYGKVVIAKDTTLNVTKVLSPHGTTEQQEAGDEVAAGKEAAAKQPAEKQSAEKKRDDRKRDDTASKKSKLAARNDAASKQPVVAARDDTPPMFPIRIKTIQFIDGSANFADYSIEPSFATGILELKGTVTGLSSDPKSRAKVKLDGKVDKYAPVDVNGEVNLLSAAMFTDLSMNFRNMELTTFNPYSGKFAGYNISKGKLSTELKYLVHDRKLDAAHHIVIDNLEFGDKTDSKDAAPIPLKLAVALLKDRHGIIDLNLPVTGTLDDPKFRLGPIIWKAVLNLLTKIVTAPFAALGALFGGGEELAFVDFEAGSAVLPATQAAKLNKLAAALVERPQLKLNVPLTVVTKQDSEAMARAALNEKLPPAEAPKDDAAKRQRIAALEKVYKEVARSAPKYPPETESEKGVDFDARLKFLEQSLLERMQPDDAALTALAQQRSRAVQDALLANTELNPERVFITAERHEGKAESNLVRMEMKLE